jgi:predicted HTH transcriptional regulator
MPRVTERLADEKIYEYVKKYGPVTSSQVREKFRLSAATFYSKLARINGIKKVQPIGNRPMILEIDNEATVSSTQ